MLEHPDHRKSLVYGYQDFILKVFGVESIGRLCEAVGRDNLQARGTEC